MTSRKSFYKVGSDVCNEATMNPEDNYPADLGMVPTGTKCGNNMVRKLLLLTESTEPAGSLNLSQCPLSGLLQSKVSGH